MNEDADFDFEEFQKKVVFEFTLVKGWKTFKYIRLDDLKKEHGKNLSGCFFIPFVSFMDKLGKKFLKKELEKLNYQEFEKEAEDLLAQDKLKKEICKSLKKAIGKDILTEDNFVRITTKSLAEKSLRKQFVIPLEPMLFAAIIYKLQETGINNFCDEN